MAALREAGAHVRVADLKPFPDGDVDAVIGDLREPSNLDKATDGVDGIIHLAALTRVLLSIEMPDDVYTTNVAMTHGLLERARTQGIERFILASTNAVVGDVGHTPITVDMPLRPLTPYGATKAAGEMLLSAYASCFGIAAMTLRFTNVWGPGLSAKDNMIPRIMRAAATGGTIQIYGDGEQVRDYVHVDDVVAAMFLVWRTKMSGPMIVGYGESPSMNELVAMVREATGREVDVEHVPAKPGEMPAVIVDITKSRERGFAPRISLPQGLPAVWDEFRDEGDAGA